MGYEENNRTVRGSGGTLATNTTGVIQTNNYDDGGVVRLDPNDDDLGDYPSEFDPVGFTIQFLKILETGSDIRMDIVTKDGQPMEDIHLRGAGFEEESIEMDTVTFRDPNNTGEPTYGYFSGE